MAWEIRGRSARKYFYKSVRQQGTVRKVYYGSGAFGNLAAEIDNLRRAEKRSTEQEGLAWKSSVEAAINFSLAFSTGCNLMVAATLLAAGFHRPTRHAWRTWHNGRTALKAADNNCQ